MRTNEKLINYNVAKSITFYICTKDSRALRLCLYAENLITRWLWLEAVFVDVHLNSSTSGCYIYFIVCFTPNVKQVFM